MGIRGVIRSVLQGIQHWLEEAENQQVSSAEPEQVSFDNSYRWLWASMAKLMKDPIAAKRPHYVWGVLQGAALGKVLGLQRVSIDRKSVV